MNGMFLYLVKSVLCVGVLFAVYWLFLRRDTFFKLNRFYLLALMAFSMLFPILPLHWNPANPSAAFTILLEPVLITPEKVQATLQTHLQWTEIAAVVYLTGVAIFLLRFLVQLIQLGLIARHSGIRKHNGQRVVFTDRGYAPFSFFGLVFISTQVVDGRSVHTILEHERVHIRQRHTLDLVLAELATIVQWFNPVVWLAGREIRCIHEYLADEGVLQNGIMPFRYQQMILDETLGIRVNNLTNNFNVSLLKKRIAMMTKSKSTVWAKGKVLIALPVSLLLWIFLTAGSGTRAVEMDAPAYQTLAQADLAPDPALVMQDQKQKQETQIKDVAPVVKDREVFTVVEKQPTYPGGQDGYTKFLIDNIKYPEEALKKGVTGTVFITFVVEQDGTVTNVKVLRGIGSGCDEEAVRVIKMMPKWNPGEQKGKPVAVQFTLPIKFALDSKKK